MKPRSRAFLSGLRSPLSGFIFMCGIAAMGGPPSPAADQMALGGAGGVAAALPLAGVATPTDAEWLSLKGVIASVIFLGAGAAAWAVVAGRNKTQSVRVEAPIPHGEDSPHFVTTEQMTSACSILATKLELKDAQIGIEHKMHEQFHALDEKQQVAIKALHDHIAGAASAQTMRDEERNEALHSKMNAIAENVAEIRGEMRCKGHE